MHGSAEAKRLGAEWLVVASGRDTDVGSSGCVFQDVPGDSEPRWCLGSLGLYCTTPPSSPRLLCACEEGSFKQVHLSVRKGIGSFAFLPLLCLPVRS